EQAGSDFWCNDLYNFKCTGAQAATFFIFSQEFKDKNTSNEDFLKVLYVAFFNRTPDTEGFNYWLDLLNKGATRESVAHEFIYSQEWADTCAEYGILSGGDKAPKVNIEPTAATIEFVKRMYTKAFNREAETDGCNYWASQLANFRCTGEGAGLTFFISEEMQGYNLSNEEFVNRLYLTFMDRAADADGKAYWIGVLDKGASRQSVVLGFTRSEEFVNRCIEARILPY
ncbi:MAG: DUF4214 domain-containing protein, partial [Clostridiales bacterium]|nr:DUF4214 domain-containing protein [Clostridiales bacterium]